MGLTKEYEFHTKDKKEYVVIRDYYVSNNQLQGIYFVLLDTETNEISTRYLGKEYMNNKYEWRKKGALNGLINPKFHTVGVEASAKPRVIFEKGTLTITKKKEGEVISSKTKDAYKSTFHIKRDVY